MFVMYGKLIDMLCDIGDTHGLALANYMMR